MGLSERFGRRITSTNWPDCAEWEGIDVVVTQRGVDHGELLTRFFVVKPPWQAGLKFRALVQRRA